LSNNNNTNNNDDNTNSDNPTQQQKPVVKQTREQRQQQQEQNKPIESLADTAVHQDLVDNPIPFNDNKDAVIETKEGEDKAKPKQKKPSEMSGKELTEYLGRKSVYRFLVVNDDGEYSYEEHKRKSINNKLVEMISDIAFIAFNFPNLKKKVLEDENSILNRQYYYELKDGKKLFTQTQAIDYYFKTIIFYSFRIPFEEQNKFATEDDKEQWDLNDAYSLRTIGRVSFDLSNYSWANFRQA